MFLIKIKLVEKVVIREQCNSCFQNNRSNVVRNFRAKIDLLLSLPLPINWEAYNCPEKSRGRRVDKSGDLLEKGFARKVVGAFFLWWLKPQWILYQLKR